MSNDLDEAEKRCRACGAPIVNWRIADGCPCNAPRGVNHGLVPWAVCTCAKCDPQQTGSSRAGAIEDLFDDIKRAVLSLSHEERLMGLARYYGILRPPSPVVSPTHHAPPPSPSEENGGEVSDEELDDEELFAKWEARMSDPPHAKKGRFTPANAFMAGLATARAERDIAPNDALEAAEKRGYEAGKKHQASAQRDEAHRWRSIVDAINAQMPDGYHVLAGGQLSGTLANVSRMVGHFGALQRQASSDAATIAGLRRVVDAAVELRAAWMLGRTDPLRAQSPIGNAQEKLAAAVDALPASLRPGPGGGK